MSGVLKCSPARVSYKTQSLSIALGFMPNEMGSAHLQAHAATASVADLNLDPRAFC